MQPTDSFAGVPTRSPAQVDRARSPFHTMPSIPKPNPRGAALPPTNQPQRIASNQSDDIYGSDNDDCSCGG